jgi:hypothetical protein
MPKPRKSEDVDWTTIDAEAVKRMIAESDAEGGEIPFDEVVRRLSAKPLPRRR